MKKTTFEKKTAVLIYNQFCNFEIAPALEMLAMARKPVTVFARSLSAVKSEEGLTVVPEKTIEELLPGALDIREVIEDEKILSFIRKFDGMPVGAISIAPLLLLKAGMLKGKPFMAGVNAEDLFEEGYTKEDLALMKGWNDSIRNPVPEGYIRSGKIVTSISRNFIRWTLAFGELLELSVPPEMFGL